jgi:hypothetical protein
MKRGHTMVMAEDVKYTVYPSYKPYGSYVPYSKAVEAEAAKMEMGKSLLRTRDGHRANGYAEKRNPGMSMAEDIKYTIYPSYKPYGSYDPYSKAIEAEAAKMGMSMGKPHSSKILL